MPEPTYFTTEAKGDVLVVYFSPRTHLTGAVAQTVGDQLSQIVEERGCRHLLLNFANVASITSLIIGKLVNVHKKLLAQSGRVAFCEVPPVILDILDLLRLTTMITAYATEKEALESMK
jgi:stage II sporulation protein AA (anti-sigma F factor antagonist)